MIHRRMVKVKFRSGDGGTLEIQALGKRIAQRSSHILSVVRDAGAGALLGEDGRHLCERRYGC